MKKDYKVAVAGTGARDIIRGCHNRDKPNISLMRDVSLMSRLQLRAICLMLWVLVL